MSSHALPRAAADLVSGSGSAPNDPGLVEQALRQYGPRLLQLAQNLLGREAAAREVLVGAFADVALTEAGPGRAFEALRQAVIAGALLALQATPSVQMPAATLAPSFLADGHRAVPVSPAAVMHLQVLQGPAGRRVLLQAIAALPDELRVVLVLRDLEGFDERATTAWVAREQKLVRQQLHLARHALWELLARTIARPA